MKQSNQKILHIINIAGKMNNLCIYDVEFKASLLRVYVDNEAGSVDLNICEKFMKTLLFLFESEGIKNKKCEVSSPGLERNLKKEWHFQAAIGKMVKIYTNQPVFCYDKNLEVEKKTTILNGQLFKFKNNQISINDGISNWIIPLNIIKKAHTVFVEKNKIKGERDEHNNKCFF